MTSSHLSFVTCHVSLVTCRLSIVTKDWDSTGLSSKSKHSRKFDDNSISEQAPNLDAWIAGRGWFVDQFEPFILLFAFMQAQCLSFCCLTMTKEPLALQDLQRPWWQLWWLDDHSNQYLPRNAVVYVRYYLSSFLGYSYCLLASGQEKAQLWDVSNAASRKYRSSSSRDYDYWHGHVTSEPFVIREIPVM